MPAINLTADLTTLPVSVQYSTGYWYSDGAPEILNAAWREKQDHLAHIALRGKREGHTTQTTVLAACLVQCTSEVTPDPFSAKS